LSDLSPIEGKRDISLGSLEEFSNRRRHILHLACHAEYKEGTPSESYIRISDGFYVSIKELRELEIQLQGYPLVILNACDTSASEPFSTAQFARLFLTFGARGVLASETVLPDSFAATFVKKLYRYVLKGQELGSALLKTRREISRTNSESDGSLISLMYSMYAPPSLRLGAGKKSTQKASH
jgi:CHAT domain-containing protein